MALLILDKLIETFSKAMQKNSKSLDDDVNTITDSEIIRDCSALQRIIKALTVYHKLDTTKNKNDQNKFITFIQQIKSKLLNDYHHLVNKHENELELITKYFSQLKTFGDKCNITTCNYTSRHCVISKHADDISDPFFNFYRKTMDSLHFYLLHLFDAGFRIEKDKQSKTILELDTTDEKENELVDQEFSRIYQCIKETNNITELYTRLKYNNKFEMKIDSSKTEIIPINSSTTELDEMFSFLSNRMNITCLKTISKLRNYFDSEEFDSESIYLDIDLDYYQNNISQHMRDNRLTSLIREFRHINNLKLSSFCCGYTFYYWAEYKHMEKLTDNINDFNCIDHSGYSPSELFIQPKYDSFKDEMLQYKNFARNDLKDLDIKVSESMATNIVKKSKAVYPKARHTSTRELNWRGLKLRYGVKSGDPMSRNHVRSLILYTDFTELCTEFSSSFRPMTNYESLEAMKARNSCYFWMSKYLREMVQIFGDCHEWKEDKDGTGGLEGPFYCGLSTKLIFPEFDLRLCSPTSTSISKEVAIKFNGGGNGFVMQLNNKVICHQYLHGFDCSSISAYKEESEVLFFGGHYQIRIESVIDYRANVALNYEDYFAALSKFGQMFNGLGCGSNMSVIMELINWKLGKSRALEQYNTYIYDTFKLFTNSKIRVVFCLNTLRGGGKVKGMIIPNVMQYSHRKLFDRESSNLYNNLQITLVTKLITLKTKHSTNLFNRELFNLFDNLQKIEILTTSVGGANVYQFSFSHLIELIVKSNSASLRQVMIKATRFRGSDSWLCSLWSSFQKQLCEKCGKNNLIIVHQRKSGKIRSFTEDCIIIEKRARPVLADGYYRLVVSHSFKSLSAEDNSNSLGKIIQLDAHNGNNQIFLIQRQESGYYIVKCVNSGLYWDICNAKMDNRAKLIQYKYHGKDNQLFEFLYFADNKWYIKAKHSGKVLDVEKATTKNGANVYQWNAHYGPNQLFYCKTENRK